MSDAKDGPSPRGPSRLLARLAGATGLVKLAWMMDDGPSQNGIT